MAWTVEIKPTARKQLKKLGPQVQRLVDDYIEERLKGCDNPRDFGKALRYDKSGLWRYRVDKYRIICQLQDSILVILVIEIGKRDKVYDD